MLSDRDRVVVEFIDSNPCRSDVIAQLFYPSQRVANRRINALTNYGYIKRWRENQISKYFCYTGTKPKQIDHMDLIARTLIFLKLQGYKINGFKREVKMDGIRPDAVVLTEKDGKEVVFCVEVERSHNRLPQKLQLYEKQHIFNKFKILYVCSRRATHKSIDIINITPKQLLTTKKVACNSD